MAEVYRFVVRVFDEVMDEKKDGEQNAGSYNDEKDSRFSACCFIEIHRR